MVGETLMVVEILEVGVVIDDLQLEGERGRLSQRAYIYRLPVDQSCSGNNSPC